MVGKSQTQTSYLSAILLPIHLHPTRIEFDPKCGDCVQQRREANADNLPLCVLEVHLSFIWLSSNAKILRCTFPFCILERFWLSSLLLNSLKLSLKEFDLYKKVEKSSSQKIQENQLVRTISYPSVIMAHGLLVYINHAA